MRSASSPRFRSRGIRVPGTVFSTVNCVRALPLAWAVEARAAYLGFAAQRTLLELMLGWLPAGATVLLAADRFYPSAPLFAWLQAHGWGYRLRLRGNHALDIGCADVISTGDFARGVTQRFARAARLFDFQAIAADIDWSRGFEFLDKELQKVTRRAVVGRRYVDKLVKVWRLGGEETWVLIHTEVQGEPDRGFARRLYTHHSRLMDRYDHPVATLVILADERHDWRPKRYRHALWGCRVCMPSSKRRRGRCVAGRMTPRSPWTAAGWKGIGVSSMVTPPLRRYSKRISVRRSRCPRREKPACRRELIRTGRGIQTRTCRARTTSSRSSSSSAETTARRVSSISGRRTSSSARARRAVRA